MTQPRSQVGMLMTLVVMLSLIAFGVPNRLVSQWTFAAEQGRIAAVRDELSKADVTANSFRLVAAAAQPSVVQISVSASRESLVELRELSEKRVELMTELEEMRRRGELDEQNTRVADMLRELREIESKREALAERQQDGTGSGVVFDDKGHILTNNHVVGGRGKITIRTADEREFPAEIVGTDAKTDLAVIRAAGAELHPLAIGDSDAMQVGDWVLAVGAPFGLSQTVTHGIISAKGRTDIATRSAIFYQDFLQTDAAINPGNSGGPLLNLRGEVIGINTAIATNETQTNAGVAFTIPSNMARKIAGQLIESGSVARGWLGISLAEVTETDAKILGLTDARGVLIEQLYEDTAASRAGLLPDDIILSVDEQPATNIRRLQGIVANITPGDEARVKVLRDGAEREYRFALDRQPDDIDA
ncbi:MAG: trypsin-like peptidase domain-containing protein, partial [Planctomycetota bacterium]